MPSDALYLRAGELLEFAVSLVPDISRAYVALATPALDCPDQLTVHIGGLARQPGGDAPLPDYAHGRGAQQATVNVATYVVTITRCIPGGYRGGTPPLPTEYEARSERLLTDLWLLWKGIPRGMNDGLLWQQCEQIILGPASAIPESGGIGAWAIPITAEVYDRG